MSKELVTVIEQKELTKQLDAINSSIEAYKILFETNSRPWSLRYLETIPEVLFYFSKYKIGDQVMINKLPEINRDSGWYHAKHFLVPGARAMVRKVSLKIYKENDELLPLFEYYVSFYNETWISTLNWEVEECRHEHLYYFNEDKLEPFKVTSAEFKFQKGDHIIFTTIVDGKLEVEIYKKK